MECLINYFSKTSHFPLELSGKLSLLKHILFFCFLIFPRWYPHHLAEQAGEVVGIFNSYFKTNLVYFHVGKVQQLASLLDFQLIEVGEWGVSGTFAE